MSNDNPRAEQDWFENSRGRDLLTTIKVVLTEVDPIYRTGG